MKRIDHVTESTRPRAAIFGSRGLNLIPIPAFIERDISVAIWQTKRHNKNHQIVIASIYFDGGAKDDDIIPQKVQNLVKYCSNRKLDLMVLADANAHSPLWGERRTDNRGAAFEQFILENDLAVQNRGNYPHVFTFNRKGASSIPDVSMCTLELEHCITSWQVTDAITSNDHRVIEITIDLDAVYYIYTRNFKNKGWKKFHDLLVKKGYTPRHKWNYIIIFRPTVEID